MNELIKLYQCTTVLLLVSTRGYVTLLSIIVLVSPGVSEAIQALRTSLSLIAGQSEIDG